MYKRQPLRPLRHTVDRGEKTTHQNKDKPVSYTHLIGTMLLVMLLGCTLLPLPLKFDIRGDVYKRQSMPEWAQWITCINPLRYFVEVMRTGSQLVFALVFNLWAVKSYK